MHSIITMNKILPSATAVGSACPADPVPLGHPKHPNLPTPHSPEAPKMFCMNLCQAGISAGIFRNQQQDAEHHCFSQ